ncbi:Ms4533A family Cys-rich leader peptide [Mycobacterium sp.]
MQAARGNNKCYVLALIAVGDCAVADVRCCR